MRYENLRYLIFLCFLILPACEGGEMVQFCEAVTSFIPVPDPDAACQAHPDPDTDTGFWQQINNGLTGSFFVGALAINSSGDIFAGTTDGVAGTKSAGVFRSSDNGDNWSQINTGLTNTIVLAPPSIRALATNSRGDIFAGTSAPGASFGGGVFRSTDNGDNWSQINTGLTLPYNNSPQSIYALAIKNNDDIFAGSGGYVYRSSDNGDTWSQINLRVTAIAVIVHALAINSRGDIFAGTVGQRGGDVGGVFRSSDNGDNWSQINTGLTWPFVRALAINSSGDIFAGTDGGVFRSTDNGDIWSNTGLRGGDVLALAINNSGDIFAGMEVGPGIQGVLHLSNNGDTWSNISSGLSGDVNALAINSNGDIFAGTHGQGVFRR